MSPSQVIVLATPVFFLLIGLEFAWGWARRRNTYRLNDAINSISLGMLSQVTTVFTRLFRVGIYNAAYGLVAIWHNDAFWMTWWGGLLAVVFYDFCYYWLHRAGHESAIFWAAHVVHHQSEDYNLSTALRQTSSGALLGWIFYLPMALAGVPPLVFGIVSLVDLLYQFWVHTEHVPKLGWFDRWFCSPSNHRVHHAVNEQYLDRNYGGILIVWDRLFGSFAEEGETCVYGTRSPLRSWDPLWSNGEVYWALLRDAWQTRRWQDKVRLFLKPPGWRPADLAARANKAPFDLSKVERFHPPMTRGVALFGAGQFVALLFGSVLFLWYADTLPLQRAGTWLAVLAAGMWSVGAVMQGRITVLQVLLIESAALATATGVEGWVELHRVFKPLAMGLAIACLAQRLGPAAVGSRFGRTLVAGLVFSLAGDCFLMLTGFFIPGLVAFLVAHLCYIAAFRQGVGGLPSRRAVAVTLGFGIAMYAFLFPRLDPVLKVAVAAYVAVISVMAAQAIGRALVLRDASAVAVAVGACFFMASDSLLAVNRFAVPLPMAQFWVLATYYVAQILIACNAREVGAPRSIPRAVVRADFLDPGSSPG
jgi:sterol desaturase/sphingolipid hydroxylase (fatty acid hydroxylase superfamily)/uncharacterized membrane protein YhhN